MDLIANLIGTLVAAGSLLLGSGAGTAADPLEVSAQPPVTWTESSHDTALASVAPGAPARRVKVKFLTADDQPREMEILYGSTDADSNITLTRRNNVIGTPNIQYPEGPGMRIAVGWAFITFHWPLIWTESIDAGSIGTTSVVRATPDKVDVYLLLNKLDKTNNKEPVRPPDCTDAKARLYVRLAGVPGSASVAVPDGYQGVRRTYTIARDAQGHVTGTTLESESPLKITKSAAGSIQVEGDAFVQKVLDAAASQGLYQIG
ncbi:MAG: hypothetical protein DYG94_02740 [Leptolyngbya sp. PLA3]|nr:MAG: hypothetical protein EDM82_11555 [Cyanobacteria bacterium CYA]MCE7967645.1 hypothetical protein [Leptolyngbya sp. PL-A3]